MSHRDHDDDASIADDGTSTRRLALVAAINFAGFVIELAGGILFGSVALISDAIHMLFDMLAYVMAFSAGYAAERFDGGETWSYGLHRIEPVAAFLNGVLLIPMVAYIVWEAYQRFLDPVSIDIGLTLVVAVGGLLVNLGSVYVLQGDEMSLNERGAFYHLLGDAGGSIAVIVSTVAVTVFGLPVADPAAAILIAILIFWSAGRVLRESTSILLQRGPIPADELEAELTAIEGVKQIDDLHVWQVCSQVTVATVHVAESSTTLDEQQDIRGRVHEYLSTRGIDHATVELVGTADSGSDPTESTTHTH